MSAEYFPHGVAKSLFTCLSCRHYCNVRVKYHKMNTFIREEIVSKLLCDHSIEGVSPSGVSWPGAVLLPTPIDMSMLSYPCLKQYQNLTDIILHVTCNHRRTLKNDGACSSLIHPSLFIYRTSTMGFNDDRLRCSSLGYRRYSDAKEQSGHVWTDSVHADCY